MIKDVNKIVRQAAVILYKVTKMTCKLIEDTLWCPCPMDVWAAVSTERFLSASEW